MQLQKTILIIEDEKSLREALVDIMNLKNFTSLDARNGKEGVKIALAKHPDLILLDLIMPEMDGLQAFQKIRQDAWGKNVPIIVLTNLSENNERFSINKTSNEQTYYLIKSDWKLHDIVKKIQEILGE